MKSVTVSLIIAFVLLGLIVAGLLTGNATLASLSCLIGWTPAMIFVGWSIRGAGIRVSVSSNAPTAAPSFQRRQRSIE